VANADGSDARSLIAHDNVSHYDWLDDDTVVAWCIGEDLTAAYWLYDASGKNQPRRIAEPVFTGDGHCSFSPDGKWMLTDTYPDAHGCRTLYIYRLADGHLIDLGSYFSPSPSDIEIRCDLHPRWSRDGKQVCIDSVHEGFRGIYVLPIG
jgi:Tol biopolymer transport system component